MPQSYAVEIEAFDDSGAASGITMSLIVNIYDLTCVTPASNWINTPSSPMEEIEYTIGSDLLELSIQTLSSNGFSSQLA